MQDNILEMRGITKEFPGVKALDNVTFQVRRGEIKALVGENGAGKSTLMNVLSGIYPYGTYSGDIVVNGEVCRFKGIAQSEAAGIAIIHQELAMIPQLSIAENVFIGKSLSKNGVIDWNKIRAATIPLLERVGLHEDPDTAINQIGVGKQQLVEIAKALSKDCKILILDEPTASLNEKDSKNLLDLLKTLQADGITCIMISHKLNEICYIADSVTVLRDGQTVADFPSAKDITEDEIIRQMVGRELSNRYPVREGVKIGEVREIDFVGNKYEAKGADNLRIYILMALNPKKLGYFEDEGIAAKDAIAYLVKERGLRASVTASGITGLSRIECNLTRGVSSPVEKFAWTPKHPFVPQKISFLDNFSDAATRVMNQINTMDLGSVWSNVNVSVESLSRTMQSVQTLMETCQGDAEKTVESLSESAMTLRDLSRELKANPSLLFRERRPAPLDETR